MTTFMVASLQTTNATPTAFPILQQVHVKDRLTAVAMERQIHKTLVTQALDMTPAAFLAFCAYGAQTVGVIRNIPQLREPPSKGQTNEANYDTSSATAACLLAVENMLNPGPTDLNTGGIYVLVSTAFIPVETEKDGHKSLPETYLSLRSRPPKHGKMDPMDLLLRLQQQTFKINASAGPLVLLYNGLTLELLNNASIAFQCFHTSDCPVEPRPRRHLATSAQTAVTLISGLAYPLRATDFLSALALDPINDALLSSMGSCFPLRPLPHSQDPPEGRPMDKISTFCILWKHGQSPAAINTNVLQPLCAATTGEINVIQTLLPGMGQYALYAHTLTNSDNMFVLEYAAQPRNVTDPRETYILQNIPNTAIPTPIPPSLAPSPQTALSPPSSLTLTPTTTDATQRILDSLQHQQTQLDRFANFMAMSALSSITSQIYILTDLRATARRELDSMLDSWSADDPAIGPETERVQSLDRKLKELETQRDLLSPPPSQQSPNPPPPTLL